MSTIRLRVLAQAESSNGINQPYKPTEQYCSTVVKLADDGYLSRGQTGGGFWLTERGLHELVASRRRDRK